MYISSDVIKAVAAFSAKKDIRYYLNGVRIQGKKLIATNGNALAVYLLPEDTGCADEYLDGAALEAACKFGVEVGGPEFVIGGSKFPMPKDADKGRFPDWPRAVPIIGEPGMTRIDPELTARVAKACAALKSKTWNIQWYRGEGHADIVKNGTFAFIGKNFMAFMMPVDPKVKDVPVLSRFTK